MKGGGQNNKKERVAVAGVKRAGGDHGEGASVGGKPVKEGSEAMEGIEEKEGEEDWGDDSPPTEGKRRRLEGAALGVGVREAIYEEIVMGRKAVRFGVVTSGTPYWEWAIPAGGVLCWIWGSSLGEHNRHRFGKDMWPAEVTGLDAMEPVDVVLFEGPGPRPTHAVWTLGRTSPKTIAWFDGNRRCRPPCPTATPAEASHVVAWSLERLVLRHAALGGVTSASTGFTVARRAAAGFGGAPTTTETPRKRPRSPPRSVFSVRLLDE